MQSIPSGTLGAARVALLACATVASAAHAVSCESLRNQIDAKIRAASVAEFNLTVIDAGDQPSGKVVGTCDLGTRKIVYIQAEPASSPSAAAPKEQARAPARSKHAQEPILTECKDGRVLLGGDCK